MYFRRSVLTYIAATVCSVTAALAQTNTTTTFTRETSFAPVGLAASETAQVNVVNLAANSSSGTAASCTGTISFVNASGTVIGTAATFTVTAGQTISAKLPGSGSRQVIRGIVQLTVTSGTPCSLGSSIETYDTATGATHAYLDGGEMGGGGGPGFGR